MIYLRAKISLVQSVWLVIRMQDKLKFQS